MSSSSRTIRTIDFIDYLKDLSPKNLKILSQYYFLENLALPMVFDSLEHSSGYACALCESWCRPDPKSWKFFIRKNLKFSDGSRISLKMIYEHYLRVQKEHTLHLNFLEDAKISLLSKQHALLFRFPYLLQDEFLYELSLPDGAFLHPRNLKSNWSVTAGAYFIPKNKLDVIPVTFQANRFFPLKRPRRPLKVLMYPYQKNQLKKNWKKFKISFLRSSLVLDSKKTFFQKHAEKVWKSFPMYLRLFTLCFANKKITPKPLRKAFSSLIYLSVQKIKTPPFQIDYQMIPKGYPSRLFEYQPVLGSLKPLHGREIKLIMHEGLFLEKDFIQALKYFSKKIGFSLKIDSYSRKKHFAWDEYFAASSAFKSNQKDPTSIWSFLLRTSGQLKCYQKQLKPLFDQALKQPSRELRWFAFKKLHRKVLQDAMLVPFAFEPIEYYTSARISLERFNPFEMRPRFFEVVMKKNLFF